MSCAKYQIPYIKRSLSSMYCCLICVLLYTSLHTYWMYMCVCAYVCMPHCMCRYVYPKSGCSLSSNLQNLTTPPLVNKIFSTKAIQLQYISFIIYLLFISSTVTSVFEPKLNNQQKNSTIWSWYIWWSLQLNQLEINTLNYNTTTDFGTQKIPSLPDPPFNVMSSLWVPDSTTRPSALTRITSQPTWQVGWEIGMLTTVYYKFLYDWVV